MAPGTPSFDLVVATRGRVTELQTLLDSLAAQSHGSFRLIVVDQNDDDRVAPALLGSELEVVHLRSAPGLSRARNVALEHVAADVVAFPDDDCAYPPDLLERVARRLAAEPALDGLSGRSVGRDGRASASWKEDAELLTDDNLWNRVNSAAIFLRRSVVQRVGLFDERLGLGSDEPWASGEEVDYVIRAVRAGARIEYDPSLVVGHEPAVHDRTSLRALGSRDGASVGYLLRKHNYPARTLARMLARPVGGVVVSLARGDRANAVFHAATLRGRLIGYRGGHG